MLKKGRHGRETRYVFNKYTKLGLVFLVVASIGLLALNIDTIYLSTKPKLVVVFPDRLVSGISNTFIVKDVSLDGQGSNKKIDIYLKTLGENTERHIFSGTTDENGILMPEVDVPKMHGDALLIVRAEGTEVSKHVYIDSNIRLLISTDKPVYQPGQTMHVRVLAFDGNTPLAQSIVAEIRDPDGNKIFRKALAPDRYGIVSFDFPFATVLPLGEYNLTVSCGTVSQQKTVSVRHYVLPKFSIEFLDMKDWYVIGERIEGAIKCRYFFGKDVHGIVAITASVYAGVWLPLRVSPATGTLYNGIFSFSTENITYAVGIPINAYNGYVVLNVTVIDEAGHMETKSKVFTIARKPIEVSVLAETMMDGVESSLYAIARYPDGTPVSNANAVLSVNRFRENVTTDARGVAKFTFIYNYTFRYGVNINITKDAISTDTAFYLGAGNPLKVIPSKEKFCVGESAEFTVFYRGQSMTADVYYDVVSSGFVVSSGITHLTNDRATFALHITEAYAPYAFVRVYKIEQNLSVVKDVTCIRVETNRELKVNITSDREVYLPGASANLTFTVTHGVPEKSVLGVKIVDKSVFELAERFTGIEALYFQLEENFTTPAYMLADYVFGYGSMEQGEVLTTMTSTMRAEEMINLAEGYKHDAEHLKENVLNTYLSILLALGIAGMGFGIMYGMRKSSIFHAEITKLIGSIAVMILITAGLAAVLYTMVIGMMSTPGGVEDNKVVLGPNNEIVPQPAPVAGEANSLSTPGYGNGTEYGASGTQAPKPVRQFFPETWYWNPLIETDNNGRAGVTLTVPDSITTWEVEAVASTRDCRVGVGYANITVFQDFFIEPDIPVSLVRNDSIALRIMIYNYKDTALDVLVSIKPDTWFELQSNQSLNVHLEPNSVTPAYFKLRALQVGVFKVFVSAEGNDVWDAVLRSIEIIPNGKKVTDVVNGRVENNGTKDIVLAFSNNRIENSEKLFAKLQTGIEAVVIDGAEEYIHFVSGCGEQSMSTLSIDVLAYRAVKDKGMSTQKQFKYEMMVTQGIQHELQYLKKAQNGVGRGIVWFPDNQDVHPWLTSWGLITFQDAINAGFTIDERIIADMQAWLCTQQKSDGSFVFPEWGLYEFTHPELRSKTIACTAYVTRALLYSGMEPTSASVAKALDYINEHISDEWNDTYALALSLLALKMGGRSSTLINQVADRIYELRKIENDTVYWTGNSTLLSDEYSYCFYTPPRIIETTGYAVMALHYAVMHFDAVSGGIKYLLTHRQRYGYFSTQDTVVAFQALFTAGEHRACNLHVQLSANAIPVFNVTFTEENADITYYVDLKDYIANTTEVSITTNGTGALNYQIIKEEYIPWDNTPGTEALKIEVEYNATSIAVNDMILVTLRVNYTLDYPMKMLLIDFRTPAGFGFVESDLVNLTENGVIDLYEVKDRLAYFYIQDIEPNASLTMSFRIIALYPVKALAQGTKVFNMYLPDMCAEACPEVLEAR